MSSTPGTDCDLCVKSHQFHLEGPEVMQLEALRSVRAACRDAKLQDRWLLGRFVAVTLEVGITVLPHKTTKVMLAARWRTDDSVAARPARTSCGSATATRYSTISRVI